MRAKKNFIHKGIKVQKDKPVPFYKPEKPMLSKSPLMKKGVNAAKVLKNFHRRSG